METIKIDEKSRALILDYLRQAESARQLANQVVEIIKNVHNVNGRYKITSDATQLIPEEPPKKDDKTRKAD